MAEKLEWMSKIRACIESSSQGEPVKSSKDSAKASKDSKDSDNNSSARSGSTAASSVSGGGNFCANLKMLPFSKVAGRCSLVTC